MMLVEAALYRRGRRAIAGELAEVAAAIDRCAQNDGTEDGCGPTTDSDHAEGFVWVGLHDPEPAEVHEVAQVFGLHPLAVEDAIKARQRPKVERYGDWLFVVLRTGRYLDGPEEVDFGEIQIFAGERAIIVIRHGEPVPLRARLEHRVEDLGHGPIAVLHAVIDGVVDSFQECLTGLDDDVSEVELEVFAADRAHAGTRLVERMYFLQREILGLHRALGPLTIALSVLRSDRLVASRGEWDA